MSPARRITSERLPTRPDGSPLWPSASRPTVLVVEDEEDIRELITYNLLKEGYQAVGVASGEEAMEAIRREVPALVVLDLMLPGIDGLSVCRFIRGNAKTQSVPILVASAKGEEADVVAGLNLGADDYLTKPFSPKVLVARVRAVLRRYSEKKTDPSEEDGTCEPSFQVNDLVIHPGRHQVVCGSKTIDFTVTEFRVLAFLAGKPGRVFTRQQILDGVHGDNYAITDRAIDVQIVGIRKKLGDAGRYIETVRGVGYRFREMYAGDLNS
ncbi:MAG: response regulator transcription factor [Thermoguttaceae bacterium]|jgi:two-component system phosphate regulon response regulator PhoB|nr:response regulator transcription factor [Thermoguttaceae bacterium]